jgi:hypothetical protein
MYKDLLDDSHYVRVGCFLYRRESQFHMHSHVVSWSLKSLSLYETFQWDLALTHGNLDYPQSQGLKSYTHSWLMITLTT